MNISDYLIKDACLLDLKADSKEGAISEIIALLTKVGKVKDEKQFYNDIMAREKLGSTGIGHKIAIPHAPSIAVNGFVMGFARSKKGVEFAAMDGDKVNLIFMMGTNPEELNLYLKFLAQLSRVLREDSFRNELIVSAKTADDVITIFKRFSGEV